MKRPKSALTRKKPPQTGTHTPVEPADLLIPVELLDQAAAYAEAGTTDKTKKMYEHFWKAFVSWCDNNGAKPLPARPKIVALYFTQLAQEEKAVATIDFAAVAISRAHKLAGHASPTQYPLVSETRKGIRRKLGTAQDKKKPVMVEDLKKMLEALPTGLRGTRDKALLLVGFMGAFRRSELASLQLDDLEIVNDGIIINIRRSKTDQAGSGQVLGIPRGKSKETCATVALEAWLQAARIGDGPIFRGIDKHGNVSADAMNGRTVARIIKTACERIELDPKVFGGHSLRAGFITSAIAEGAGEHETMNQSRHKSRQVFDGYVRMGRLFKHNAGKKLDL